jgi:quinol monooxygenase YgiN
MTAFNVVRMRVKPGHEEAWLAFHRDRALGPLAGMRSLNVVHTGEREYLVVGEWENMDAVAAARPAMIAMLDSFRNDLEDLGAGLGVTEPRSGEAVISRRL